jgi:ankyrin repeat protein
MKRKDADSVFEIDERDNLSLTSLMKAAINNHLDLVKMLLNFGSNPRLKTNNGDSSLTLACMQENFEIC